MKRFFSFLLCIMMLLSICMTGTAEGTVSAEAEAEEFKITGVNVTLQYLNAKGKAAGDKLTEISFGSDYTNPVTNEACKGGSLDVCVTSNLKKQAGSKTWVLNGHRYTFNNSVKTIIIKGLTENLTVEIVASKAQPTTAVTGEEAIEARADGQLIVETEKAKFCFLTEKGKQKGGWLTTFDFTDDYTQPATGETVPGGSATVFVKVTSTKKQASYWLFDETEMHFSPKVSSFTVRDLNVKKHYEPVLKAVKEQKAPDPEPQEIYYTVSCSGCTFSGGGYSGATSGKVKKGTTITCRTSWLYCENWYVNGGYRGNQVRSISVTINSNTHIKCEQQIN